MSDDLEELRKQCKCFDGCPRIARGWESCDAPFCGCNRDCPYEAALRAHQERTMLRTEPVCAVSAYRWVSGLGRLA